MFEHFFRLVAIASVEAVVWAIILGMLHLLILKLLIQEYCQLMCDLLLQVYLPTGMYVDASIASKTSPFLNIRVQASVTDYQHTEGTP